ncbi:MAG TPA: zinc-ribbon domain-containing protein [Candidatus Binatia bacterium]
MKSGKQRRAELKTKRKQRKTKQQLLTTRPQPTPRPLGTAPVNEDLLAPYKSYGAPGYVMRGYYQDIPFRCQACGKEETWTAAQQKWWYEVGKGYVYSSAKLCRPCRKKAQARRAEVRRVHLDGVARKKAAHRGD